jgi:hypothetical protein
MGSRAKWDIILPKPLKVEIFDREFEKAARHAEEAIKRNFDDAVKMWRRPPVFRGYVRLSGNKIYISVGTTDEIFGFVDQGTKPHIIKPVNAKMLHWKDESGEDHFAKEVHHPGFKGRHITDQIEKEWGADGRMAEYFENGLHEAVLKSGHAIR